MLPVVPPVEPLRAGLKLIFVIVALHDKIQRYHPLPTSTLSAAIESPDTLGTTLLTQVLNL